MSLILTPPLTLEVLTVCVIVIFISPITNMTCTGLENE